MFAYLPRETRDEIEQLTHAYGEPIVKTADLAEVHFGGPINSTDRFGEVCMVLRRLNGRLLTMRKSSYPDGIFRLPTGGINHGEPILDALLRETYEETGLQVQVRRFLAAIAYQKKDATSQPFFYTFAFLLDEVAGELGAVDLEEDVEAYLEVERQDLLAIANELDTLGKKYEGARQTQWSGWGTFRAIIHRSVWEALEHNL